MARIPTYTTQSRAARQSGTPRARGIPVQDFSSPGLIQAGNDLSRIGATLLKAADDDAAHQARVNAQLKLSELETELQTEDPMQALSVYDTRAEQIIEDAGAGLSRNAADTFRSAAREMVARSKISVQKDGIRRGREKLEGNLVTGISGNVSAIRADDTAADRQTRLDNVQEMIEQSVANRVIAADTGARLLVKYQKDADIARAAFDVEATPDKFLGDIESGDEYTNLPGKQRAMFMKRAANLIKTRKKEEARQAEIEKNRAKVQLNHEIRDAVAILDRGLTPDGLTDLQTRADEYEAAYGEEITAPLRAAQENFETIHEFVRADNEKQIQMLSTLSRQKTFDRQEAVLLERLQRARTAHNNAVEKDPLGYGQQIGLYELGPVSWADPDTLAARVTAANVARDHFGTDVPILRTGEIEALKENFDSLSGAEVTQVFASLRGAVGEDGAFEIGGQVTKVDPALGVSIARSGESPLVASAIVTGNRLRKENKNLEFPAAQVRNAIEDIVGNTFKDTEGSSAHYIEAAKAIYAQTRIQTGDLSWDLDTFENALKLVVGGDYTKNYEISGGPIEFNKQKLVAPVPGMEQEQFEAMVENIGIADMQVFGNGAPQYDNGKEFDIRRFGNAAQFITVGHGVYRVHEPGLGYIKNENGQLYEIDLRSLYYRGRFSR
jgi:hypothetical protein